jgi:hypothetical protein
MHDSMFDAFVANQAAKPSERDMMDIGVLSRGAARASGQ